MEKISIEELLVAVDGILVSGSKDKYFSSVSIDSREEQKGSLFVPINGSNINAHRFIEQAFKNGAVATLMSEDVNIKLDGTYIKVDNTTTALQKLAAFYRRKFTIPVIGITGSVGKTSTKEMISSVLSARFNVHKTIGNFNGQIGLPITVFNLNKYHEVAVLEMGISEFDEMDRLSKIAAPNYAVITNIGVTHIENLKTKENILKEKFKIINTLDRNSKLFINGDDELLSRLQNAYKFQVVSFGINNDCTFTGRNIVSNGELTEFDVIHKENKYHMQIETVGEHNVLNAIAAVGIGIELGLSIDEIKNGLLKFKPLDMRQQIYNFDGIKIIDDSYNANPDSMKSALNVLCQIGKDGRKIAVLADMLELGESSEELHYMIGKHCADLNIDILLTVGEEAKYINNGARENNSEIKVKHFIDNNEVVVYLSEEVKNNDVILVKGSRGMKTDFIVKKMMDLFKK